MYRFDYWPGEHPGAPHGFEVSVPLASIASPGLSSPGLPARRDGTAGCATLASMSLLTHERELHAGRDRLVVGRRPSRLRKLAVAVVVTIGAVSVAQLVDLLPSLRNPFGTETVDRSQPAVLKAVADLSRYEAASGNFQVIVDLEKDARLIPDFIRGERTLFVAAGSVEASVDFGQIGDGAVTVTPDGTSVTVALPRARLSDARIDPEASRVVSRQRGLLDRLGGVFSDTPTGERQLYLLAERKVEEAARAGGVRARAEANTRTMLKSMLASLGYTDVTVTFGEPTT